MERTRPELSAIILNYKNPQLTVKCVEILLRSLEEAGISSQVIVVDNSAAETAGELRRLLPGAVEILENPQNLGFAKATNQGIRVSRGEYILLLNNDVFVNSQCLKTGLNYLKEHPNTGIWAPQLAGSDGHPQVSCARFPTLKSAFGEYLLGKQWNWYGDLLEWKEPRAVETVNGAFNLLPKAVFDQVGLLDEDFFFTGEDLDFCKRLHQRGFPVVYDPRCRATHLGGASQAPEKWFRDPYLHRHLILYYRKHQRGFTAGCSAVIIHLGLLLRRVLAPLK